MISLLHLDFPMLSSTVGGYVQVRSVLAIPRFITTVVAIGPLVCAANVGKRTLSARMKRDIVPRLLVDALNDVDLADGVLLEVVGPASRGQHWTRNTPTRHRNTYSEGQTLQATPGMC